MYDLSGEDGGTVKEIDRKARERKIDRAREKERERRAQTKLVKSGEKKRQRKRERQRRRRYVDWRVDAGKRRTRERTVHGNEKDLCAHARERGRGGYGVALRADLWFHDAANNYSKLRNGPFIVLPYYYTMLLRWRETAGEEFSFSERIFHYLSRKKMPKDTGDVTGCRKNIFMVVFKIVSFFHRYFHAFST